MSVFDVAGTLRVPSAGTCVQRRIFRGIRHTECACYFHFSKNSQPRRVTSPRDFTFEEALENRPHSATESGLCQEPAEESRMGSD